MPALLLEPRPVKLDAGFNKEATMNNPKWPSVSPAEVAQHLQMDAERILLVDCRPLLAYNCSHIKGAVHVNCSSIGRKRLSQGKTKLKDLISSKEGKEKYMNSGTNRTSFVVYDDLTRGPEDISPCRSAVFIVLQTLFKEGKEMFLLKGGLKEFCKSYESLCENASSRICETVAPNCDFAAPPNTDFCSGRPRGPPASAILPFLFLGSEEGAADESLIDRLSIKFILNMTPVCPNFFNQRQDIHYKQIKICDSYQEDIGKYFDEAIEFIDEARSKECCVLVHCHAGVSRSATVAVAYVMQHMGMSLNDAYKFVKEKRPTISPNLNFMGHLLKYEKNKKNGE